MSDTSNRKEQHSASSGKETREIDRNIVVRDADGRLRRGVVTFKDLSGRKFEGRILKWYNLDSGLHDGALDVLPVAAVGYDVFADIVVEEPTEGGLDEQRARREPEVLSRLSDEQQRALLPTLRKLRADANRPVQIVALDPANGTILIQETPHLLKTLSIATGEIVSELQLAENYLFVDKSRSASVASSESPSSPSGATAEAAATTEQEAVSVESDKSQNARPENSAMPPETPPESAPPSANQILGESMIRVFRDSAFMTRVPPEESELTRLRRLNPAERKKEEDRLFNELKYS